jgi:hypothetical protein
MDREFHTNEFEQLLKEKSDQFRLYPSKRVWHSIYNDLHPSRRWPSAAMSMLLIISLMLIGYLNTGDNTMTGQFIGNTANQIGAKTPDNIKNQSQSFTNYRHQQPTIPGTYYSYQAVNLSSPEFFAYTIVKSNKPNYLSIASSATPGSVVDGQIIIEKTEPENTSKDLIQTIDTYIKSNQIFADVAILNSKKKVTNSNSTGNNINPEVNTGDKELEKNKAKAPVSLLDPFTQQSNASDLSKVIGNDEKTIQKNTNTAADKKSLTPEEKAWIENFAFQNKPGRNEWKSRLRHEFYVTPAVNYRKLSTNSKGSTTPFANSNINNAISQKPGLGVETGVGLSYSLAKKLRLKGGIQFNYTNYNIDAGQTNHPTLTSILLNDPNTGYSYTASRTSTISNSFNSTALEPVTLHNRTYQISIPVGLAYRLSGTNNVEWFAGASVQPTYVFGGKAHLISSDLKSYVSDPSSIRNWNLNLGFETFMSYKLGAYNLQVGPQVRYQVYSTYRKNVALVEKPYAIGLKIGLIKGF